MSLPVPQLDDRTFDDLVAEAKERIARKCPQWTDFNPSDPGMMLVDLMAWVTETALYRLNRVPEKNYLKFLELIGVELKHSQPARTRVFFQIKKGLGEEDLAPVPAGTRLSTRPMPGGNPIVFETCRELRLTSRRILRAHSSFRSAAGTEQVAEHSLAAGAVQETTLFQGAAVVRRCLYLGFHSPIARGGRESLTLHLKIAQPLAGPLWWEWEGWNGERWEPVVPEDATQGLRRDGQIQFDPLPKLESLAVRDLTRGQLGNADEQEPVRWLRARLTGAQMTASPVIDEIRIQYGQRSLPPARILIATQAAGPLAFVPLPQPTEMDLLPLGNTPEAGNTLYVESPLFQHAGASISIEFDLETNLSLAEPESLEIHWEYRDTEGNWRRLGSSGVGGTITTEHGLADGTDSFTKSGTVRFICPENIAQAQVAGQSGWFVRARLERAQFRRPVQGMLRARSVLCGVTEDPRPLDDSISENYGEFQTHPSAEPVTPFPPNPERDPAFYLCFDGRPSNEIHHLFFDLVRPGAGVEPQGVQMAWEYQGEQRWMPLELQADGTRHFTRAGSVQFLSPADWVPSTQLGFEGYWLRVRWEIGELADPPRLRQILLNGVDVVQALRQEVIRSGTGEPGQSVPLPHGILAHPEILIREKEKPTPAEITSWRQEFGDRLLEEVDRATARSVAWVKWEEVKNFYRSGASDRHFAVDLRTGRIQFGDGKRGAIPPKGGDNIRVICRISQGANGNAGAGTITVLDGEMPQVTSVSNLHPAEGGTDPESVEEARLRGPWVIKHRDRAVTEEDFVELAKEASPLVGAARCYAEEGLVHVVVVPASDDPRPLPNQRLVSDVSDYLDARRLINTRIRVEGPVYQTIELQTRVVLRPSYQGHFAEVAARIRQALHLFVHPLKGGSDGSGWPMGRALHLSELYYLLESVDGIEVVEEVRIRREGTFDWTATRISIPALAFPHFNPGMSITQAPSR